MVPRRSLLTGLGALAPAVLLRPDVPSLPAEIRRILAGRDGVAIVLDAAAGAVVAAHDPEACKGRLIRPGSAFKPVVAGLIGPNAPPRRCQPVQRVGGRRLDCTHPTLPFPVELPAALAYSCNSYFLGARLKFRDLRNRAGGLGWFAAPSGGRAGMLLEPRNPEEASLQLVGEWGVEVTLAGLAEAYRRLALEQNPLIVQGLEDCIRVGTGQLAAEKSPVVIRAGKTGTTAEAGTSRLQALFAGWTPSRKPEHIVAVWLPAGRGGPDAAPLAGEVFGWLAH